MGSWIFKELPVEQYNPKAVGQILGEKMKILNGFLSLIEVVES